MVYVNQNEDSSLKSLAYARVYGSQKVFGYEQRKLFVENYFKNNVHSYGSGVPPVLWVVADYAEEIEGKVLEQFASIQDFINAFSYPIPKVYGKNSVVVFNDAIPFKPT